jgi:hypothetical protein
MARFLGMLLASPDVTPLLSSEQVSVDGTLLRVWASHRYLERIEGIDDDPPPSGGGKGIGGSAGKHIKRARGDCRGLRLSNQTHRSSSDGEARLFRKSGGTGAFLSHLGHCLMENRHGLVVASEVTPADGYGERAAALTRKRSGPTRATTPGSSWLICALPGSRRMSLRAPSRAGAPPSTAAPFDLRAKAARSMPGDESSRCLAGSSRPPACGSSRPGADRGWGRCFGCT